MNKKGKKRRMLKLNHEQFDLFKHSILKGWSAFFLMFTGFHLLLFPQDYGLNSSLMEGFLRIFPNLQWKFLFISVGLVQSLFIVFKNEYGCAFCAFIAAMLFIWGSLNICVYSYQLSYSLIILAVSAFSNLYLLVCFLIKMEQTYEYL